MRQTLEVALGLIMGAGLYGLLTTFAADFKPKEFGLGRNTHSFCGTFGGQQVSAQADEMPKIVATLQALHREGKRSVLWLGASQLHAINQPRPLDELAVVHANRNAQSQDSDLRYVQLSEPNANLHELWAMAHYVLSHVRLDAVVLGFTYDDLREPEVRSELLPYYAESPVDETVVQRAHLLDESQASMPQSLQAKVESAVVSSLEAFFPTLGQRDLTRAFMEAHWRLGIVTAAFAFIARPQEAISATRARWNRAALDVLLHTLSQRGIKTLVYQAPHRPGMARFHHPRKAYDAYHKKLETDVKSYGGAVYLNLQNIVPAQEWGINAAGQPDVFHFTAAGHQILGQAIDDALQAWEW